MIVKLRSLSGGELKGFGRGTGQRTTVLSSFITMVGCGTHRVHGSGSWRSSRQFLKNIRMENITSDEDGNISLEMAYRISVRGTQ